VQGVEGSNPFSPTIFFLAIYWPVFKDPAMNPADLRKLKDAFNTWAATTPEPDAPVMGLGTDLLSARQIAREVEAESKVGKDFIEMMEHGVKKEGIDAVVARMTRKP
jgi:hypothetical protein